MSGCRPHPLARLMLAALLAFLLLRPGMFSYGQATSESQIKAAFLVNFLKYMEWPGTSATATICLFGRDALEPYLASYEGRQVAGRELHIRRVAGPDQIPGCQILFIPENEEARFSIVLRWVDRQPVLTVSDTEIFTSYGGAIALVRSDGRLQFDINTGALNRAGLKPNSQLMKLARSVKDVR